MSQWGAPRPLPPDPQSGKVPDRWQFQVDGRPAAPIRECWQDAAQDAVSSGYASWSMDGVKLNDQASVSKVEPPKCPRMAVQWARRSAGYYPSAPPLSTRSWLAQHALLMVSLAIFAASVGWVHGPDILAWLWLTVYG